MNSNNKIKITTQMVVNYLIAYAYKHGEAPKDWPTLVASIDESEATQKQILYKLLYRKTIIPQDKVSTDPEIILYSQTLNDMGIENVSR
jgi:hypothetical protein